MVKKIKTNKKKKNPAKIDWIAIETEDEPLKVDSDQMNELLAEILFDDWLKRRKTV